jgi:hypothetical protein
MRLFVAIWRAVVVAFVSTPLGLLSVPYPALAGDAPSPMALAHANALSAVAEPGPASDPVVPAPSRIHGSYHIAWNGLDLGDFTWDSTISAGQYKATTDANISALFGAYTWEGITRVNGGYSSGVPHPESYRFRFQSTDKSGRVDMTFVHDAVKQVSEDPPDRAVAGRIPLTEADLENVMDPLSAIMALSVPQGGRMEDVNPCQRRLPIFDGRMRFDLALSYKRKARLDSGGARYAFVCAIKFIPIAGHKMNTETKFMASTDGIEVWLAPVASANVFMPYYLEIPTWAGSAQITAARIVIDMPGHGRIALSSH